MAFTKDDFLELTDLLRTSADPFRVRMRALLSERGVNVTASILVESFPDDACFEFGVLIAPDEKSYSMVSTIPARTFRKACLPSGTM